MEHFTKTMADAASMERLVESLTGGHLESALPHAKNVLAKGNLLTPEQKDLFARTSASLALAINELMDPAYDTTAESPGFHSKTPIGMEPASVELPFLVPDTVYRVLAQQAYERGWRLFGKYLMQENGEVHSRLDLYPLCLPHVR